LENYLSAFSRRQATLPFFQIQNQVVHSGRRLVPLLDWPDIDGANHIRPISKQALHQMTADETPGTANRDPFSPEIHVFRGYPKSVWKIKPVTGAAPQAAEKGRRECENSSLSG
jgi:hypothetical protein